MIKLGDRITVKPATFDVPGKDGKPTTIRESFQLIDGRVAEWSTSNQHRRDTARALPGR